LVRKGKSGKKMCPFVMTACIGVFWTVGRSRESIWRNGVRGASRGARARKTDAVPDTEIAQVGRRLDRQREKGPALTARADLGAASSWALQGRYVVVSGLAQLAAGGLPRMFGVVIDRKGGFVNHGDRF